MNAARAAATRSIKDHITTQIGLARRRRPNPDGLIAGMNMTRVGICVRIDRDSTNAEPACSGCHAAGDLASIGDQDLVEHTRLRKRVLPKSTPA